MDWSSMEQNWKEFRRNVKQKWVKLSDEDLDDINGRRERLEETIQARYVRSQRGRRLAALATFETSRV